MATIDRVHWKVGDFVSIYGKGIRTIEEITETGVVAIARNDERRLFPFQAVTFAGPADCVNWERGTTVYVGGTVPIVVEYVSYDGHSKRPRYVEWDGDWNHEDSGNLTSVPLDPKLVEKARLRDQRVEFEATADKLNQLAAAAPKSARRWLFEMAESFEEQFAKELQGEKGE